MASTKLSINVFNDEHLKPDLTSTLILPSSLLRSLYSLASAGVTFTSNTKKEVHIKREMYTYA